jgi:hypothetical protein
MDTDRMLRVSGWAPELPATVSCQAGSVTFASFGGALSI